MVSKILIVDDEPDVVEMLQDYFELNGYSTLSARNGKEALAKVSKQPDLILLDINMPNMDGLELCKQIREFVSCPILFLTARAEDTDKIKGFAVGGDDYIVKPFSIDELGARVAAHIRRDMRVQNQSRKYFGQDVVIDYSAKEVYVCGQLAPFSKTEFDIIELLSTNAGQVFDKERIYEYLVHQCFLRYVAYVSISYQNTPFLRVRKSCDDICKRCLSAPGSAHQCRQLSRFN